MFYEAGRQNPITLMNGMIGSYQEKLIHAGNVEKYSGLIMWQSTHIVGPNWTPEETGD